MTSNYIFKFGLRGDLEVTIKYKICELKRDKKLLLSKALPELTFLRQGKQMSGKIESGLLACLFIWSVLMS